jgi:hypothetical protein
MLPFLGPLVEALEQMQSLRTRFRDLPLDEELSAPDKLQMQTTFFGWQILSKEAEFPNCFTTTEHVIGLHRENMQRFLADVSVLPIIEHMTARQALNRLDQLDENYRRDTSARLIWLSAADRSEFFDLELAVRIAGNFPSAISELREASYCYALERDTASVFHLMRAVENVLRCLVASVGVTSPEVPLEFQQWQNLIDQFDSRSKVIEKWPTPEKLVARRFFKRILADLHAFKDDIRNVTFHTRTDGVYDGPGALSVWNRVSKFFEFVSKRTGENVTNLLDENLFRS